MRKAQKKIFVTVKIDVVEEVVVANGEITKGESIKQKDLVKIKKNISGKRWGYQSEPDLVVGQTAKRHIFKNEELKNSIVEKPKVLEKGAPVKLVYRSENLYLTNMAIALKSGRVGDMIPVKTMKSKKTIFATIVDDKHVQVAL